MEIIWKTVDEAPDYEVNNLGEVRHKFSHHKQSPKTSRHGYLEVGLMNNGKRIFRLVHRIVAKAFIDNPNNERVVNHKNKIRTDNRVENLEWCSQKQNVWHGWKPLSEYQQLNLFTGEWEDFIG